MDAAHLFFVRKFKKKMRLVLICEESLIIFHLIIPLRDVVILSNEQMEDLSELAQLPVRLSGLD